MNKAEFFVSGMDDSEIDECCEDMKDFLKGKGYKFKMFNVLKDPLKAHQAGIFTTPTLVISDGKETRYIGTAKKILKKLKNE